MRCSSSIATRTDAAYVASVATANHDELTRSSTTALEGGLATDGSVASAEEYLRPIKAADKVPPPWLNAIARHKLHLSVTGGGASPHL
jgi:hypothetical protein